MREQPQVPTQLSFAGSAERRLREGVVPAVRTHTAPVSPPPFSGARGATAAIFGGGRLGLPWSREETRQYRRRHHEPAQPAGATRLAAVAADASALPRLLLVFKLTVLFFSLAEEQNVAAHGISRRLALLLLSVSPAAQVASLASSCKVSSPTTGGACPGEGPDHGQAGVWAFSLREPGGLWSRRPGALPLVHHTRSPSS